MSFAPQLNTVTHIFASECRRIFGEKLCDVKLFGAYARNDYDDESEIEIIVLVDMEGKQLSEYLFELCHVSSDLDFEFNVSISPMLRSISEYEDWKNTSWLYKGIERDGISILL